MLPALKTEEPKLRVTAPACPGDSAALKALSISQLDELYRRSPERVRARIADGLEPLTRIYESHIASELQSREATTPVERMIIDRCSRNNRSELRGMAAILRLPEGETRVDPLCCSDPEALRLLIEYAGRFSTMAEREALIAAIDKAIEYIDLHSDQPQSVILASQLVEVRRRGYVRCPLRIEDYLKESVARMSSLPPADEKYMVLPLLAVSAFFGDSASERRAVGILNRCYRYAVVPGAQNSPDEYINNLTVALSCCEFITDFNITDLSPAAGRFFSSVDFCSISSSQLVRLHQTVSSFSDYFPDVASRKEILLQEILRRATKGDLPAVIYCSFRLHK